MIATPRLYETVEIRRHDAPEAPWIRATWSPPGMWTVPGQPNSPFPPFDYEWRRCQDGTVETPPCPPGKSARRQVLEEAADTVDGPRNESYGGPEDSFQVVADLWAAYLKGIKYAHRGDYELAAHDVAAMMALLKIARLAGSNGDHWDSWVDLAGYAACGAECAGVK